jgi:hypothetical protein
MISAVVLAVSAVPGFCGPIIVGNWYADGWSSGVGSNVTGSGGYTGSAGTVLLNPGTSPFTFTGAATLIVADLFIDGDQFQVFDNVVSIGTTPVPANDGATCGNDPLLCTSASWSRGVFALGPGSHSITMTLTAAATGFTIGGGAFEIIPEPATFALMGLGILGIIARRKLNVAS